MDSYGYEDLGYNNTWVKLHMRPQLMWWVKGHLGSFQVIDPMVGKKWSPSPHTSTYSHRTWTVIFGNSCTFDLNRCGVKGHLGIIWVKWLALFDLALPTIPDESGEKV